MKSAAKSDQLKSIAMFGLIAVIGLYGAFQYYFLPASHAAASVEKELRAAQDKLKGLEAATANQEALQVQYRQVEQAVASLRKSLPNDTDLPAVMEVLSDLASKSNVKIQTIFPERSAAAKSGASSDPAVFKEIPIQIDAISGYHELGMFLNQIEVGDKPMQVTSLRITSNAKDPRRHQVNMLLRSYFAITEDSEKNDKNS